MNVRGRAMRTIWPAADERTVEIIDQTQLPHELVIVGVLHANAERAKALVRHVVPALSIHAGPCRQGCQQALDHALITAPERRDPEMLARLDAIAGRVLRREETA